MKDKSMKAIIPWHYDGLGLNDLIEIYTDEHDPNSGGASHAYAAYLDGEKVLEIQFQRGPRGGEGSTGGVTEAVLMAILIDRLEGFQAGPYACPENATQLNKIQEALHWTRHRAEARKRRGVLGKNER